MDGPKQHLNPYLQGMKPSATVALNEHSDALLAQGRDIIKFGLGQSPFPVPKSVVAALQAHAHEKDYLPVKGLRRLRDEVADFHARRNGIEGRSGNDVIVGPGSKELIFLLQLVYNGDLVIPAPAWVSYAPQARILGREVRMVPTRREDGWRITAKGLASICEQTPGRPRILILNYPSNPTGLSYDTDQLQALAETVRRYEVIVVSDEIYGEIHHDGAHVSLARWYPEGTIVSSGLSKWCGAGGWRIGTFFMPTQMQWLLEAMATVASETYTSVSAPIQYAAIEAFRGNAGIEDYLVRSRRVLKALGTWCSETLRAAGSHCDSPDGAFYLFPDLEAFRERLASRDIHDAETLCSRLLSDTGVAILPGTDFGRPPGELTVRLAYVDFNGAQAIAAADLSVDLDESWMRSHCPRVLQGVERFAEWLNASA